MVMGKSNKNNVLIQTGLVIVIIILLIALAFVHQNSNKSSISQQSASTQSTNISRSYSANYSNLLNTINSLKANYSSLKTQYSYLQAQYNASKIQASNSSIQIVKQVLYSKKTVSLPAASYNPYYNYVIGCYWTAGAYNFSFNAPYPGYIVYNETNTGIPANFSYQYFSAYISTQKPRYFKPQPYNDSSYCPGWDFLSTTEPWTDITSYNNQTLIIPIKNGTNYVLFFNLNANQQHGVNPFPINVTFSMTYYGFKGAGIPQTPNTTVPTNIIPSWSKFGGN